MVQCHRPCASRPFFNEGGLHTGLVIRVYRVLKIKNLAFPSLAFTTMCVVLFAVDRALGNDETNDVEVF